MTSHVNINELRLKRCYYLHFLASRSFFRACQLLVVKLYGLLSLFYYLQRRLLQGVAL